MTSPWSTPPPSVDIVRPVMLGTAQMPLSVLTRVDDPGEHDRQSLKVTLSSNNAAFGAARTTSNAAGDVASTSVVCRRGSTR